MEPTIVLGWKVRDIATGVEGVATSRVEYLSGGIRYGVTPAFSVTPDGRPNMPGEIFFNEGRLRFVDSGVNA